MLCSSSHISSLLLKSVEGMAIAYEPLSSNFDWTQIQEELQELGDSMNCDVELKDVTGSSNDYRVAA